MFGHGGYMFRPGSNPEPIDPLEHDPWDIDPSRLPAGTEEQEEEKAAEIIRSITRGIQLGNYPIQHVFQYDYQKEFVIEVLEGTLRQLEWALLHTKDIPTYLLGLEHQKHLTEAIDAAQYAGYRQVDRDTDFENRFEWWQ